MHWIQLGWWMHQSLSRFRWSTLHGKHPCALYADLIIRTHPWMDRTCSRHEAECFIRKQPPPPAAFSNARMSWFIRATATSTLKCFQLDQACRTRSNRLGSACTGLERPEQPEQQQNMLQKLLLSASCTRDLIFEPVSTSFRGPDDKNTQTSFIPVLLDCLPGSAAWQRAAGDSSSSQTHCPYIHQTGLSVVRSSDGTEEIIRQKLQTKPLMLGNKFTVHFIVFKQKKESYSLILPFRSKKPVSLWEPWAAIWPLQPANTQGSVVKTCKLIHEEGPTVLVANRKQLTPSPFHLANEKGDLFHGCDL